MIIEADRYYRSELQANRHSLYVFGDNLEGVGLGGQAKEARGEPNAVGIVTKRYPGVAERDYLCDADLEQVRPLIRKAIKRLQDHLDAGGIVILPKDGIGTGLAQLERRAPLINQYIIKKIKGLRAKEYHAWP